MSETCECKGCNLSLRLQAERLDISYRVKSKTFTQEEWIALGDLLYDAQKRADPADARLYETISEKLSEYFSQDQHEQKKKPRT